MTDGLGLPADDLSLPASCALVCAMIGIHLVCMVVLCCLMGAVVWISLIGVMIHLG